MIAGQTATDVTLRVVPSEGTVIEVTETRDRLLAFLDPAYALALEEVLPVGVRFSGAVERALQAELAACIDSLKDRPVFVSRSDADATVLELRAGLAASAAKLKHALGEIQTLTAELERVREEARNLPAPKTTVNLKMTPRQEKALKVNATDGVARVGVEDLPNIGACLAENGFEVANLPAAKTVAGFPTLDLTIVKKKTPEYVAFHYRIVTPLMDATFTDLSGVPDEYVFQVSANRPRLVKSDAPLPMIPPTLLGPGAAVEYIPVE